MRKLPLSTIWESEKLFFEGDDYFGSLLADMDRAQKSVTMEMYIFNQDQIGQLFIDKFIELQKRGVTVQLIVDGVGSYHFFDRYYEELLNHHVEVKMYNPLPFYHPTFGDFSLFQKFKLLMIRFGHINKRNHRKITIIDEEILYSGSYNITSDHSEKFNASFWLDLGVRVTGDPVKFAVMSFKKSWKFLEYRRYKSQLKKNFRINWKALPIRLNSGVRMRIYLHRDLRRKMRNATERIWITTPYFIPTRSFIKELALAARRGVDVKLLISAKTDVKLFNFLQYFYYPFLLKKGVKVFRYTPRVLHAKNYIIDDWMIIGTTNLNHRSFIHDLEVDTVVCHEENKLQMDNYFNFACQQVHQLTVEELKKENIFARFFTWIIFIFRYWM